MSQLNDAKLLTLRTELALEGHINDLEILWLLALGATSGSIVDAWWEVFDAASIAPGQFNDRAVAYITATVGAPPTPDYNAAWLHYWENATLVPPVPQPPLLPDLFHWYDFTDPTVLWQDVAGTIPIVAGQDILRVDDKGTEGTVVLDDFPPGPVWQLNLLNGYPGTINAAGFPANLQDAGWGGASPPGVGVTIFSVGREDYISGVAPSNHYLQAGGPGVMGVEADPTLVQWAANLSGAPQPTGSGRAITLGEWVWNMGRGGPTNTYETSGTPPVFVVGPYTQPAGGTITLGQAKGSVMEVLVYGRELTGPEVLLVAAYFDAKYGVLPFLTPPPTAAALTYHHDFTDNATVWSDVAQAVPAVNGGVVRAINGKSASPIDLTSASGIASPTYRTAVVNGLNVADFDQTADQVNGVAAAWPIATVGGAAMVVFRQIVRAGGAFVDPIYRFTGTPGIFGIRGGGAVQLDNIEFFGPGFSFFSSAAPVLGTWYLAYISISPAFGGVQWFLSGGGEQASGFGGASADLPAPAQLRIETGQGDVEVAEAAIWTAPLSAAERAALVVYADGKYGTLPHA